jgi:hypothetical protein
VSAKIFIPPFLQQTVRNTEVIIAGNTIGECVHNFVEQYPGTKDLLLDDKGQLNWFFELLVDGESVYAKDLSTPVKEGAELHLLFIIAGG